MSRPSHDEIAQALVIDAVRVRQLERRGMPTATIGKARAWFEKNGLRAMDAKPHAIRRPR